MANFICTTCGTQYAESDSPPVECAICEDERQFVGWSGQQWTTLDDLRQSHQTTVRLEELGLYGIGMEPTFAIGQRALLISRPEGNVLWDCIPLIDDGLVEMVKGIGGISAIRRVYPGFNEGYYGYDSFNDLLKDLQNKKLIDVEYDPNRGNYKVRMKK